MSWVARFASRMRVAFGRARLAATNLLLGPLRAPSLGLLLGSGLGALGQSYGQLPSRLMLDWSPDDLRAAMAEADGGSLSLAADLCESLIMGDDRAPAVLGTRVKAVQGSPLAFAAAPTGRLRRRALKAAQAEEDWWGLLPDSELEELRIWRLNLGVALGELVWTEPDPANPEGPPIARVRNGRHVPQLKVWYPGFLRKDPFTGTWKLRTADGSEIDIRPGDSKWVLLTAGGSHPWRKGLWRGMAPLCLLKAYARDDWGEQSEKYASGVFVVTVPDGGDEVQRKKLAKEISDLAHEGVIILAKGMDCKALELQARSWETFQAQIALANTSMSITAIGTNLPTEVSGGAGTGATAQGAVRQDYLEADAARDEVDLREQVLMPWARFNFGQAELAPWPVYRVVPPEDQQKLAVVFKTVFEGIEVARRAEVPIAVVEILQRFDIPVDAAAIGVGQLPPIFAWHVQLGVVEYNEVRDRLKLSSKAWGNQRTGQSPSAAAGTLATDAGQGVAASKPQHQPSLAEQVDTLAAKLGNVGAACARLALELGAPLTQAEQFELVKLPPIEAANDFARMFQLAPPAPRRKAA